MGLGEPLAPPEEDEPPLDVMPLVPPEVMPDVPPEVAPVPDELTLVAPVIGFVPPPVNGVPTRRTE